MKHSNINPSVKCNFYHSMIWIENGILYHQLNNDLVINSKIAKDIIRDRNSVLLGEKRPLLFDITDLIAIDPQGRELLASEEAVEFINAMAIYSMNPIMALVGRAFILLDKPKVPAHLFTSKKTAERWLEEYKFSN